MMWMKVAVVALLLWWWSHRAPAGSKAASGDVSLGDDFDVDFRSEGGEWNPYYVKGSSVDLEPVGAGAGVVKPSSPADDSSEGD